MARLESQAVTMKGNMPVMKGDRTPDLVVYSYPKTGRTWLRFLLANYLSLVYYGDRPVTLQNVYEYVPNWDTNVHDRGMESYISVAGVPLVALSHTPPTPVSQMPTEALLVRDPRDTIVSHWHHANHHYQNEPLNLEEFVLKFGPAAIYGHSLEVLSNGTDGLLVFSYEEMHASAVDVLVALLSHACLDVNHEAVEVSVGRSTFSRMQVVEASYGIKNIDYDLSNPLARRVRRGVIGSHQDELPTWAGELVKEVHSVQLPWLRDLYEKHTAIGYYG
ncbi:sulfotransferase (plasmid) [Arthrobacter sp. ZXY-2]|nr:sulfotransferase [Arthrobacter sp. ZXY-2]